MTSISCTKTTSTAWQGVVVSCAQVEAQKTQKSAPKAAQKSEQIFSAASKPAFIATSFVSSRTFNDAGRCDREMGDPSPAVS